ncbi:hypothetical protein CBL_00686 [Carabus blaptoides fortunei]
MPEWSVTRIADMSGWLRNTERTSFDPNKLDTDISTKKTDKLRVLSSTSSSRFHFEIQNQVDSLHVLREMTVPEPGDVDGSLSSGPRCAHYRKHDFVVVDAESGI